MRWFWKIESCLMKWKQSRNEGSMNKNMDDEKVTKSFDILWRKGDVDTVKNGRNSMGKSTDAILVKLNSLLDPLLSSQRFMKFLSMIYLSLEPYPLMRDMLLICEKLFHFSNGIFILSFSFLQRLVKLHLRRDFFSVH